MTYHYSNKDGILFSFWRYLNGRQPASHDSNEVCFQTLGFLQQVSGSLKFTEYDNDRASIGFPNDSDWLPQYRPDSTAATEKWLKWLQENGYELNAINNHGFCCGETPLHRHLSTSSRKRFSMARLLIDLGADIHAVDSLHRNALHCALRICKKGSLMLMEEKLNLLVGRGVNISHCDVYGNTPSDLAFHSGEGRFWDTWCRVLQQNGREILEVLEEEENLDLIGLIHHRENLGEEIVGEGGLERESDRFYDDEKRDDIKDRDDDGNDD